MQKREIQFHRSMNADKRNENFAYLRKGMSMSPTAGMYPAIDYVKTNIANFPTNRVVEVFPDGQSLVRLSSTDAGFISNFTVSTTPYVTGNYRFVKGVGYGEGGIYSVLQVSGDWEVHELTGSSSDFVGEFDKEPLTEICVWDGLYYWWIGGEIWRQLPYEDPELMMNETGFGSTTGQISKPIINAVPYENNIVIFCKGENNTFWRSSIVYFYDKASTVLFSKRVNLAGKQVLGSFVIEGRLMMLYNRLNSRNNKDSTKELVVAVWNGSSFQDVNSILYVDNNSAGVSLPQLEIAGTNCKYNDSYALVSVEGKIIEDGSETVENPVFRIYPDGKIEVAFQYKDNDGFSYAPKSVGFFENFMGEFAMVGRTITATVLQENTHPTSYTNYANFTHTEYITNFYCNPFNRHKLTAINITFEKLVQLASGQEAKLELFYRTSDRDTWVSLGDITRTDVIDNVNKRIDMSSDLILPEQRYQITKMPDGSALPEFNEIQFKFKSYNGFSIIGCWFEYDYLTRNTLK